MTPDDLKAIEDRAAKATPGPWSARGRDVEYSSKDIRVATVDGGYFTEGKSGANQEIDAEFIAAARTDIPELVAEIKQLSEEREAVQTNYQTLHHDFAELSKTYGDSLKENTGLREALIKIRSTYNIGLAWSEKRTILEIISAALEGK